MRLVAICRDLDTTLLATWNTVLRSCVGVGRYVWGSSFVYRIKGAVDLALLHRVGIAEKSRVHTRLASYPREGNGGTSLEKEE